MKADVFMFEGRHYFWHEGQLFIARVAKTKTQYKFKPQRKWEKALGRMVTTVMNSSRYHDVNPWVKRFNSAVAAINLRIRRTRLNPKPVGGKRPHEPYRTHDWDSAIERMMFSGFNKVRRAEMSSWQRAMNSIAINQNRRMGITK